MIYIQVCISTKKNIEMINSPSYYPISNWITLMPSVVRSQVSRVRMTLPGVRYGTGAQELDTKLELQEIDTKLEHVLLMVSL